MMWELCGFVCNPAMYGVPEQSYKMCELQGSKVLVGDRCLTGMSPQGQACYGDTCRGLISAPPIPAGFQSFLWNSCGFLWILVE